MAEQQYIDYGNVPNSGTGDPLRDAFIKVDDNFTAIWEAGPVGSNIVISNNTIAATDTNGVIILSPNGVGNIQVNATVIPRSNNVYSLGTANNRFRTIYSGTGGIQTTGNIVGENIIGNLTLRGNLTANIVGSVYALDGTTLVDAENNTHYGDFVGGDLTAEQANVSGNLGVAGNVAANYFIGDGSRLTNLNTGTGIINGNSNVTVAANSYVSVGVAGVPNVAVFNTSNVVVNGDVVATGNISGTYLLGNGAFITGLPAAYGNANVASYLPTYSGNLNPGNVTATGNISGTYILGNGSMLTGVAASSVDANNLTGTTLATNVVNSSLTSVGTLTSLSVSGNANLGNVGANNAVFTGAGSFGANVNMNTHWINNVGYPNAPTDVASKAYVDTMISSGLAYHPPVAVATTTTLAIATSGTTAYVQPNGAGNGIGSYISTTGTFLNIDSANVQTVGTRILVKNEANAAWNGVYTYSTPTRIIRASDADQYGPDSTEELSINDFFFTQGGVVNKGVGFVVSAPAGAITFGTSNITFTIFTTSQVYDAGTGLSLNGVTFSISNTAVTASSYGSGDRVATFTVNQQGQLTAAANVAITANAANLTGTTLASSIVNSSLTKVGTLADLAVAGNVTIGGGINLASSFGTLGQVITANGSNGVTWSSQFYVGNAPPQAQSITPNYGDLWYYVGDDGEFTLYVWLTDGTSEYFFDLLPPVFINN